MKGKEKKSRERAPNNREVMREAHQDLQESKQLVKDLLQLKKELRKSDTQDAEQVEEFKEKAIDAINHLFNDEVKDDA